MDTKSIGRLLTPKEAAERLRSTLNQLATWRWAGIGPKYFRLGHRTIRYCAESVEAFLRNKEAQS